MSLVDDNQHFYLFCREDKDDQILDYKQEIQTMEEQLRKLQKEVQPRTGVFRSDLSEKKTSAETA